MYQNAATAAQLRDDYIFAAALVGRQIEGLKAKIAEKPPHSELCRLEELVELLYCERRDLNETAAVLAKEAAPKPPSPSLAARARACR